MICYFHQRGILTSVDSDESVLPPFKIRNSKLCLVNSLTVIESAKTRSDRDKLCHFCSKMKSQESQNKLFLSIASYLVHLILEGFC